MSAQRLRQSNGAGLLSHREQPIVSAQTVPNAVLTVDRNKWFVVALAQTLLCVILAVLAFASAGKERLVDIYWVKLQPNGRWDVQAPKADSRPEFYPETINHFLERWVISRYSQISNEVRNHYGFVHAFMTPQLQHAFKSTDGYNAVQKAADIESCNACAQTHVKVRDIHHQDAVKATFGRSSGTLYRSDIYIMKEVKNLDGSTKEKSAHIVPIKWRLKTKQEIQADLLNRGGDERFRANPVGIEIIEYNILNDRV